MRYWDGNLSTLECVRSNRCTNRPLLVTLPTFLTPLMYQPGLCKRLRRTVLFQEVGRRGTIVPSFCFLPMIMITDSVSTLSSVLYQVTAKNYPKIKLQLAYAISTTPAAGIDCQNNCTGEGRSFLPRSAKSIHEPTSSAYTVRRTLLNRYISVKTPTGHSDGHAMITNGRCAHSTIGVLDEDMNGCI